MGQASDRDPVKLSYERKLFTDTVKLCAYDLETRLFEMASGAFRRAPWEGRALIRDILQTSGDLVEAIIHGAVKRVRPKAMTVAVIVAGLLPIMLGSGTGSEVMHRIAAPMVGGMLSATLLTLVVIPSVFLLWKRRGLREQS